MKALLKEYSYERKIILLCLFIGVFIYGCYIFVFENTEIICATIMSYVVSGIYGELIGKRKNTNFERFLAISPLGKKGVLKAGYLIGLLNIIICTIIFWILFLIKQNFESFSLIKMGSWGSIMFLGAIGVGLLSNAIRFPIYLLEGKDFKILATFLAFLSLFISFGILYYIVFKLTILEFNIRVLIFLSFSIIVYITSYFITKSLYLKKDL